MTFNYYSWATKLIVPILTFRKPVNESSRSTASGMHTTPCSRDAEYTLGKYQKENNKHIYQRNKSLKSIFSL